MTAAYARETGVDYDELLDTVAAVCAAADDRAVADLYRHDDLRGTGVCTHECRTRGRDVGVDADHDVDDLRQTIHALLLCSEGRGRFRSGRRKVGL
jgi:hypothetical protein